MHRLKAPVLLTAAAACEDKKAEDIPHPRARAGERRTLACCNGTNERQNVAITDEGSFA